MKRCPESVGLKRCPGCTAVTVLSRLKSQGPGFDLAFRDLKELSNALFGVPPARAHAAIASCMTVTPWPGFIRTHSPYPPLKTAAPLVLPRLRPRALAVDHFGIQCDRRKGVLSLSP